MRTAIEIIFVVVVFIAADNAFSQDQPKDEQNSDELSENQLEVQADDQSDYISSEANNQEFAEDDFLGMKGILDEAVRNLAQIRNAEGLRLLKSKDYPGALELFKQANNLESNNAEYADNLGYIYYLLGNFEEAEFFLRKALELSPDRQSTYVNLADLLGREGEPQRRLNEAAQLLKKAREMQGNKSKIILRQARISKLMNSYQDAARFYSEYAEMTKKMPDKLIMEIGDFFREIGRESDAISWYRRIEDAEELGQSAASKIWDIEVERQAKKYGWSARIDKVPEKALKLVEQANSLSSPKQADEVKRLLENAVEIAPWFVEARIKLGDLLFRMGKHGAAELTYLKAAALSEGSAEVFVALGDLYLDYKNDNRASEAVLFYERALELNSDWPVIHFKMARALQRTGEPAKAIKYLDAIINNSDNKKLINEALQQKKMISKLLGLYTENIEIEADKEGDLGINGMSEELINALNRAKAHLARGRPDAAMAELKRLPKERQGTIVMNLEAKILNVSGRTDEAVELLKTSIKVNFKQPEVHEQLATILLSDGDKAEARRHFEYAYKMGNESSGFYLAKLNAERKGSSASSWLYDILELRNLITIRKQLTKYINGSLAMMYVEEAKAVQEEISGRIRRVVSVLIVWMLLSVTLAMVAYRRIWGGADIGFLLKRYPDSAPEVQRILSAIRHEVLKHNTLALGGIIDSFERGDKDAAEKGLHFRNALTGSKDDSVSHRLNKYANELVKVGRAYGIRLNLKHKEPAIASLYKGLTKINGVSVLLGNIDNLTVSEKKKLLHSLKTAFRLINIDGYQAVQQMLGRIKMQKIDEAFLRSIAVRVLREPSFINADVAPVTIDAIVALPLNVMISQQAFEDIIANLYRNALQSSLEEGLSPVEIGIAIDLEVDDVTGHERAVFMINDQSKKELTSEMIKGRAIEGGLGLTADLAARYDGMIDVVPGEKGWSKSIKVKLPIAPEITEGENRI